MNTLSDEEFEQIYGRKPVRRVKKKKIYWNRIIIALIILIGIVTGLVKLTALVAVSYTHLTLPTTPYV